MQTQLPWRGNKFNTIFYIWGSTRWIKVTALACTTKREKQISTQLQERVVSNIIKPDRRASANLGRIWTQHQWPEFLSPINMQLQSHHLSWWPYWECDFFLIWIHMVLLWCFWNSHFKDTPVRSSTNQNLFHSSHFLYWSYVLILFSFRYISTK